MLKNPNGKNRMTKDRVTFVATAWTIGTVLGGCFGSMPWGHTVQGLAIGGAAGLAVAWLVLFREANA